MLESFPTTTSGKLDRKALPAPKKSAEDHAAGAQHVEAASETERVLAGIWAEVLQTSRVSVTANFFEIGGDSILALRIVGRSAAAGMRVAVHEVFGHPTVRGLAALVDARPAGAGHGVIGSPTRTRPFELLSEPDRARVPAGVADAYPLSALQSGMVFHSERAIGSYLYQVAMSIHVRCRLDREKLRRAAEAVFARHPLLRTSFDLASFSEPVQLVHETVPVPVEFIDIREMAEADQNALLARWIDDEAEYVFDWRRPPFVRYTVHERSEGSFQFGITFHDAILDGWSTSNMTTELFERYLSLLETGTVGDTAPNPVRYADFVRVERATLRESAARDFWTGLMDGAPFTAVPRLTGVGANIDRPRNLDVIVPVPAEVNARVEARAKALGLPVKAFYLAVHARVLGLVCSQGEVVTGLVMNGRLEEPMGDRCLGNHLNTMPYRLGVQGRTWAELARAAHAAEMASFPHRRYTGAQLLRDLGRGGQDNLFETGFNYTNFHVYDRLKGRAGFELVRVDFTDPFHYAFVANFRVDAFDDRLDIVLNYNTAAMTNAQVKQYGRYYVNALRAIAEDPGVHADAACLLGRTERASAFAQGVGPVRAYPGSSTLQGVVLEGLGVGGGVVGGGVGGLFVEWDGVRSGVEEMGRLTASVARAVGGVRRVGGGGGAVGGGGEGLGVGDLVGVMLDRSVELVGSLWGVVASGARYVPLDPEYPLDRLVGMGRDAGVGALIGRGERGRDLATQLGVAFIDVGTLERCGGEWRGVLGSMRRAGLEDVPYAIFTSGSTGRPKGALNTQAGVVNRLRWMQESYGLTGSDVLVQKTPFSFDVSVWEFFWPLVAGCGVVVARPGGHRDAAYLAELMGGRGVTVAHFVPSMLGAFLEEPTIGVCRALRRIVCSGEALTSELCRRVFERLPGVQVTNLYGPTEAAVDVTQWEVSVQDVERGVVPIGRAAANVRMYVLDAEREPVPSGVAGELWIAGVQVGLGYANRPELTAERFVADPFVPGERMYRTGDLGRIVGDGVIEYLGRIDHQVKIRGLRIELGEIESVLSGVEGVKEAAVLAREDVPGVKRLVGYVVPRVGGGGAGGGGVDAGVLRGALLSKLPEYMVPSSWVMLESFPTTTSGKLDRKALPAPKKSAEDHAAGAQHVGAASRAGGGLTATEATLVRIWEEVLRGVKVGLDDNFFEIGGDSILSIQISAKARRAGIGITPNDVFEHPTVRRLASVARVVDLGAAASQGGASGPCGLVPVQRWLLDQDLVNPSHWNAAILVEFPREIPAQAVERGVRAVVEHHDALRLRFWNDAGTWRSEYTPSGGVGVSVREHAVGEGEAGDALIAAVGDGLQRSLDIGAGRCFAAAVFRVASGPARLLLVAHHLVLDGFSWRVIVEDVQHASTAAAEGRAPSLPPRSAPLSRWATALRVEAEAIARDLREVRAWEEAASVSGEVRADRPGADNRGHSLASVVGELDEAETSELLQRTPAASGVQVQEILLGALGAGLRETVAADRPRLRLDMLGHGREPLSTDVDTSRTVGWLTTVFPVVLDLSRLGGTGTGAGTAVSVGAEALRAVPRRGLSFGLLRYLAGDQIGARLVGPSPDVSFNYLGQFDQSLAPGWSLRVARARCGVTRDEASVRPYAIEVDAMAVGGRLVVEAAYSAALHDRATIEALVTRMLGTVRAFLAAPSVAAAPARRFAKSGLSGAGLARLSALFDSADTDTKPGA
jgi:amino acid adenylation domain-containing protein/non-ribosomal peptide synthase protein (TIGR01720 family)